MVLTLTNPDARNSMNRLNRTAAELHAIQRAVNDLVPGYTSSLMIVLERKPDFDFAPDIVTQITVLLGVDPHEADMPYETRNAKARYILTLTEGNEAFFTEGDTRHIVFASTREALEHCLNRLSAMISDGYRNFGNLDDALRKTKAAFG